MNSFFDIMGDILTKKSGGTLHEESEFKKHFSAYMLARYLSMKDDLIVYGMIINKYQTILEPAQLYKWAYNNVPRQRSGFIKYIKKSKGKKK